MKDETGSLQGEDVTVPQRSDDPGGAGGGQHETLRSVARGGLLNLVGSLVYGLSGFVMLWVLVRELGTTGSGVVLVAIAAFNILAKVGELGSASGLVRFNARLRALHLEPRLGDLVQIVAMPLVLFTLLLGALLFVLAGPLAEVMASDVNPEKVADVLRAMAPLLPFAVVHSVFVQGTRGFDTMRPQLLIEKVGRAILLPLSVWGAARAGFGPAGVARAWASTNVIALIATVPTYRWLMAKAAALHVGASANGLVEEDPHGSRLRRDYWRFALPRLLGQLMEVGAMWVDTILVAALASVDDAAIYATATRWVLLGVFASEAVMQVVGPRVSGMMAKGRKEATSHMLKAVAGWQVGIVWPVYVLVIMFAPTLLSIFGDDVKSGAPALTILSVGMMVAALFGPAQSVVLMSGRSRVAMLDAMAALFVNVAGNFFAIPRWGMTGAGAVWAITLVVQSALPSYQARTQMDLKTFGHRSFEVAVAALSIVGVVSFAMVRILGQGFPALITSAVVGGALFAGVAWWRRQAWELDALFKRP